MKFNESLLKNKIKDNLKGIKNDLDRDSKANAIVEALNFFDLKRDWVEKINRDEIISLVTNSPSQDVLCESVIAKVNNTPFTKSLKESKNKKKESKKLNESLEKKTLNEQKLEEGTSNFYDHDYLPLLVFMTYDEILDAMDCDSECPQYNDFENEDEYYTALDDFRDNYIANNYKGVCILDEYAVDDLQADLIDFNSETKSIAYELDVNEDGYQEYGDNLNLEDIQLAVEPGYYEGAQIKCKNEKNFDYLSENVKTEQLKRFNDFLNMLQQKYGLTKLKVAYKFSNGETGYNIVEELKHNDTLKESEDVKLNPNDYLNCIYKVEYKRILPSNIFANSKQECVDYFVADSEEEASINAVNKFDHILVTKVTKATPEEISNLDGVFIAGSDIDHFDGTGIDKIEWVDFVNPDTNLQEADDLQTKATKMMSEKKYYIDLAWKNGKTWKTDPMTLDEIGDSVDAKVTEKQFVDMMSDNIKGRKDAKNLTKAEIVKVYDYMDGQWQGKDVLWSINDTKNESLNDQLYNDNTKNLANQLVAMAKKDGKELSLEDACEVIDQSFNDEVDNLEDFYKRLDFGNVKESLNEDNDYYAYMDKDFANVLDKDVDVYDVKQFVLNDTDNKFRTHYSDEYAIIVCPNGKGCVVDYEAVGQDFDSVDGEIEFGIEENEDGSYTDENGVTHKTINIFATHTLTTTPKEVMEKAPKKTMKYRDFFRKYKYNDRCASNFKELVSYIEGNGGLQESCKAKKKKTLKEGYIGQTLEDFFYDCVDPEVIETVSLWGSDDVVYEGDYDGAIEEYGNNEFIEFDCGMDKVVINVDTSEEYQVTDYFVDVQDFLEFYNGDEVEVYDINEGKTLFSGDRYDLPDDVAEKIFVSFDAPKFISINIEEDIDNDDDDDFDENLKEALGKIQEVTKVVDCDGNEFHVKPIWKTDRLATLVDKDGNETKVEIADLRQYYDLYDQDDKIISRFEDNVDESLKESNNTLKLQNGGFAYISDYNKDQFEKEYVETGKYKKSGEAQSPKGKYTLYTNSVGDTYAVLEENLEEDTVKKDGKWVNKGNTGETHGEFKTKKEADKQRKAMFVNKKPTAKWGK